MKVDGGLLGYDAVRTCRRVSTSALEMEAVCSYKSTRHHNPGDHNGQLRRRENLMSESSVFISTVFCNRLDSGVVVTYLIGWVYLCVLLERL
jgi:hypothetical protein